MLKTKNFRSKNVLIRNYFLKINKRCFLIWSGSVSNISRNPSYHSKLYLVALFDKKNWDSPQGHIYSKSTCATELQLWHLLALMGLLIFCRFWGPFNKYVTVEGERWGSGDPWQTVTKIWGGGGGSGRTCYVTEKCISPI